jgi:Holliday junction resolvasome RuvABC endonuclease subunit
LKILALDLGTKTGVAYRNRNGKEVAFTWELTAPKKDRDKCVIDPRLLELRANIRLLCAEYCPQIIVYEDVQFVHSQAQAHLWSALRTVIWLVAYDLGTFTAGCPVKTLKKFAIKGNADKDDMRLALLETLDMAEVSLLDDNAVDSLWLLRWAECKLTELKSTPLFE